MPFTSNKYDYLTILARLRFWVVDEAYHMISQGNFPQLWRIFDVINRSTCPLRTLTTQGMTKTAVTGTTTNG